MTMHSPLRVALVCGGVSTEHEISLLSCYTIYQTLKTLYACSLIYITKTGDRKYIAGVDFEQWYTDPIALAATGDRIQISMTAENTVLDCDVVFPVLHGKNGEDGTFQWVCEMLRIPYVGCGVLSSALCMDKHLTKVVLEAAWIPVVPYVVLRKGDRLSDEQKTMITARWRPVFVKPARSGSSVGVSKCTSRDEIEAALHEAFGYDTKVLIEKGIIGYEPECAVLWSSGSDDLIVWAVGRIINHHDFYSYEAKYLSTTHSTTEIPATIPDDLKDRIQTYAKKAFVALECEWLARVDFLVSDDSVLFLNEVNTMPWFTTISMYPKMLEAAGITYEVLLQRLVEIALHNNTP